MARSLIKPKTLTSLIFSSRNFASSTASSFRPSVTQSFLCRIRPLSAVAAPSAAAFIRHRGFSTRATSSSLNDPNPNWSNRPPKETILLDGCDFEHWLVVMDPPEGEPPRDEIIQKYIKTLAQVVGSEEEARMKIYSVSTRCYFAFGALVSEEVSYKIKELPNVRWVLPDSYLDVKNKDYGGEPFINGEAVPYDPKYHEEWIRNNARANERNRKNDRPRNHDRSRNFERRRENMQNRDFQTREPVSNQQMQQAAPNHGGLPPQNQGAMPPNRGAVPPHMQNSDFQNRDPSMANQRVQQAAPYQGGMPPPNQAWMPPNQGVVPPNMQNRDFQNRVPPMYNQHMQQANQGGMQPNNMGGMAPTGGMHQNNMRGWTPNNMGGTGQPSNTGGMPGVPQNNYVGPNNTADFQSSSNVSGRDVGNIPTYPNRDS